MIRYDIRHATVYEYDDSVSVSHHVARLRPRRMDRQLVVRHEWNIEPEPAVVSEHADYFGNIVTFFAVEGPHDRLTITSRGAVDLMDAAPLPSQSPAWETVRDRSADELVDVFEFMVDSPLVSAHAQYASYGLASFPSGQPLLEGVIDLTRRIHEDLRFDPTATDVTTPLDEVFRRRSGVCQDFAHLQIACLRSLGLAARYVSGYLETTPPPDAPRLVGADASHAWVSVYVLGHGWVDVDPTNNLVPADKHITLGWGRDYTDVSPIRGVILGGGEHRSRVAVDIVRTS
jgi:transglutaminase-like putative cysteine protease